MDWKILNDTAQLEEIKSKSFEKTQVIFKHSTRCSISSVAKGRLEKAQVPENVDFYYLDLINYRNISKEVADKFKVFHESPQVLVIRNGECVYDESHMSISMNEIAEQATA
ncbi:MAG: bacillithiol system redox-active protein YtxJ [Flavitalea sp.]